MEKSKTLILSLPLMLILLGLVLYQYGYSKVSTELAALKEEHALKTKQLGRYIELIAEKPHLEKQLAALVETRKTYNTKLIEGQTPSLAAAVLQDTVNVIITGRGGTINTERVGKPEDLGKFKLVTITIDAATLPDTRALSDVLYSIETRTPYLHIKELEARVRDFNKPRELMVKLEVAALMGGK